MTEGLLVLVQLVIAAMTTAPWPSEYSKPSYVNCTVVCICSSLRPKPCSENHSLQCCQSVHSELHLRAISFPFSRSFRQFCLSLLQLFLYLFYPSFEWQNKARFPLPELTAQVDGWPVSITHQHGPCWRVMELGPLTRVVETGLYSDNIS